MKWSPAIVCGALAIVSPAEATRCVGYPDAAAQIGAVDAIFRGRVISTRASELSASYENAVTTFAVIAPVVLPRTWDAAPERIEVRHCANDVVGLNGERVVSGSCVSFTPGAEVLIAASLDEDRHLRTGACTMPRFSEAEYRAALALAPAR